MYKLSGTTSTRAVRTSGYSVDHHMLTAITRPLCSHSDHHLHLQLVNPHGKVSVMLHHLCIRTTPARLEKRTDDVSLRVGDSIEF